MRLLPVQFGFLNEENPVITMAIGQKIKHLKERFDSNLIERGMDAAVVVTEYISSICKDQSYGVIKEALDRYPYIFLFIQSFILLLIT
jgi:hypothetical protein